MCVALPSAQRALHFSNDSRQWVVTAYALAFGSLLLLVGGKVGDLFGRKWALIAGLLGFSGASAVGGLAQSFDLVSHGAEIGTLEREGHANVPFPAMAAAPRALGSCPAGAANHATGHNSPLPPLDPDKPRIQPRCQTREMLR